MRIVWFGFGMLALGLGLVGIFLPLLPTTPFILLAAYAFARSSDRWHRWLLGHRVFGSIIHNWREHGAIGRRARITALLSLVLIFSISLFLGVSDLVLGIQGAVLACVGVFIMTRPLPPAM